jgi:ketosteroid isomerase-like protein
MTQEESKTDANVAIARAAYEAYAAKDRATIERLLTPDFHFTSPLDNRIDRVTYFARCWPNSETIKDLDFINLVADGDRVFVTYEGHHADGRSFRNTEIVTVRQNQIVEVEVYFGWSIPHKAKPGGFLKENGD